MSWIICKAFRERSRISGAFSRLAVAVTKAIGSFVRHSGEAAKLVGPRVSTSSLKRGNWINCKALRFKRKQLVGPI